MKACVDKQLDAKLQTMITATVGHKVDSLTDTVQQLSMIVQQLFHAIASRSTSPATESTAAHLRASASPAPIGLAVRNG